MAARGSSMQPFVVSREFNAPRELVWQAWTEPERLKKWWGPKGFTVFHCKVDLRPGGTFLYGMRMPDGKEMWGKFLYEEVKKPERLAFIVMFSDAKGGTTRHPFNADWPQRTHSTVLFTEKNGKTTVTVQWLPAEGSSDVERKTFDDGRASMQQGWGGTMDQLETYLGT